MSDWGIPDWKDPKAYGDTRKWSHIRWRWEFYRRREDLRLFFEENAAETYRYAMLLHSKTAGINMPADCLPLCPNDAGFKAITGSPPTQTFGYRGVPNPRISDQPSGCITPVLDELGGFPRIVGGEGQHDFKKGALEVSLASGECAAIFDLNMPLRLQIEGAVQHLKARQIMLHGKTLQERRHPSKWLNYLRVLDAREAKASWRQIRYILPQTAKTDQSPRDTWKQARALCFNF